MANVIYFADTKSLEDEEIRHQVLRIPEVMSAVRGGAFLGSQAGGPLVITPGGVLARPSDHMNDLLLEDQFRKVCPIRKMYLFRNIQNGLFARFVRHSRVVYSDTLYRHQFRSAQAVAKELRWMARSGEGLTVYVIGPGFDEVPMLVNSEGASGALRGAVRASQIKFIEIIDADPGLQWFWSSFRRAASA